MFRRIFSTPGPRCKYCNGTGVEGDPGMGMIVIIWFVVLQLAVIAYFIHK